MKGKELNCVAKDFGTMDRGQRLSQPSTLFNVASWEIIMFQKRGKLLCSQPVHGHFPKLMFTNVCLKNMEFACREKYLCI